MFLKVTTPSETDVFEKAKKFASDSAKAKISCNFWKICLIFFQVWLKYI